MASLLISGCISQANNDKNGTISVSAPKEKVTVGFFVKGNSDLVGKTVEVEKGANALEEMKKLFDLNYSMSQYGAFVTGINGEQAPANSYWAMYVDENYAQVGISSLVLDKNMSVSWRLEEIQMT